LSALGLPVSSIIAGVIRNKKGIIPSGDFVLKAGDKIVVFALPTAIQHVEKIFE